MNPDPEGALQLLDEAARTEGFLAVGDLLRLTESVLSRAGYWPGNSFGSHRDEAQAAVAWSLGLRWLRDDHLTTRMLRSERNRLLGLLRERLTSRTPLPYLLGHVTYDGLQLEVNRDTFIPRNAIIHVIEDLLATVTWSESPRMLDLGTGVGAVTIAVGRRVHDVSIDATDISAAAIAVARRNVSRHRVADRVAFHEGDLFAPVPSGRRYDLMTSNLPYIPDGDRPGASAEVQREPASTIFRPGDGLDLVRRLLVHAADHLEDKGTLVLEVGAGRQRREVDWMTCGRGRWWSWRGHELGLVSLTRDALVG